MKNGEKKVSIIVPVYQAKGYLEHCIDSILRQTYQNIELLLVDDGSDDGSEKLCDDYARQYANVVCIHQKNSGVSHARNVGIEHAQGEYLLFVDSDDYIEADYVESACLALQHETVDMYLCGYQSVENRGRKRGKKNFPLVANGVWRRNEMSDVALKLFDSLTLHAVGTKVYKKSLIAQYALRFHEKWKYYEDIYFCLCYLSHCQGIYVQNRVMYFYRRDTEHSLSKQPKNCSYVSIHRSFCLLHHLIRCDSRGDDEKRRFGELYLEQIDLCLRSKIITEKWYTRNLHRLYRRLAKDRLYTDAVLHSGNQKRIEFLCIRFGICFGAYLICCYRMRCMRNG